MSVVSIIAGALLLCWGCVGMVAALSALFSGATGSAFHLGYVLGLTLCAAISVLLGIRALKGGRAKVAGNAGA